MKHQFSFLRNAQLRYTGRLNEQALFIQEWQLKDSALWKKFVNQFRTRPDGADKGWRGEYWGKMMRGACLTYQYTKDEQLYTVLETAVKDLLTTQDELGRISTYPVEAELHGWDMWGRKYVLTGLQHFYDICKDEDLKTKMVVAMSRHMDAIIAKVGGEKDKVAITETSEIWGSVNSCSILEPTVRLYALTDKQKYLDFAEYILSTGGCKEGDLIADALAGKLPHEICCVKAYEVMSFFEGALAYYEVTGKEKYLQAVDCFMTSVIDNELSIIGNAGCNTEHFDHTVETQTNENVGILQETCVTVTMMRIWARLLCLKGDVKYANALETAAHNAMPGSVNTQREQGKDYWGDGQATEAFPFDSYSPLYVQRRGAGVGGYKLFQEGGGYGCCACIGSAGTALIPLTAVLANEKGFVFNEFYEGRIVTQTPKGNAVCFEITQHRQGRYALKWNLAQKESFSLFVRVPTWCEEMFLQVGDEKYVATDGYFEMTREWNDGDVLTVETPIELRTLYKNGKVAFFYGAYTLCRDWQKDERKEHLSASVLLCEKDGKYTYEVLQAQEGEAVRLSLLLQDGKKLLLSDYASCGKNWNRENADITVWFNIE